MRFERILQIGFAATLGLPLFGAGAPAQQGYAQYMATVLRPIMPPESKCYFGAMNGNAICEITVNTGADHDTLRVEAGQFDLPLRVKSIQFTQTTTNRNSPAGLQQMQVIQDFTGRWGFTNDQLVSCMRSGVQDVWQGIGPGGFGMGAGSAIATGGAMNCKVNLHAPNEGGATTTIDLHPPKGPNEF